VALTPQNNEAFLREVDEEYRREQMIGLWQRYGRWIVVAVIAILVAFAAYLFWQHRQRVAAEKEGETLQTAYDYLGAADFNGAAKPLAELAQSKRDGYRTLALFSQADVLLAKNDLKGAAAKFASVANDASIAKPFRDLALIRQTAAEYDTLKPDVVIQRMTPLAVGGNAYLGSAGEMMGAAYLAQGKRDLAGQTFARIARDKTVPASLRQRAVQMAGVLGIDVAPQDGAASRGMTE